MAARQDQGLQIGLIISIFAFIACFVFAYVYWKGYRDSEQTIAQLNSRLQGEQGTSSNLQSENERLREITGFGRNDNLPDVEQAFEGDMERMAAGFAEEDRLSYREVLQSIYRENESLTARENTATQQLQDLSARLLAVETEKEKQVEQFQEGMRKLEEDAAAQRVAFQNDRSELERKEQELLSNLDQQRTNYQRQLDQERARAGELESQVAKLDRAMTNLLEERADSPEVFEVADGRISWVNQDGTVWINLGAADALRRQVTFAVYDSGHHDAARAAKKGSIEVTRILGDHMAEARITQDDPRNPILTGDQVYSQAWHRGKQLRFALVGNIDINGNGRSDLQLARDLIELNGGAVDAYLTETGQVEGQITVSTRYLVLGEFPEGAARVEAQENWNYMIDEARNFGVQSIRLDEFLAQMGFVPTDRTVRLGAGSTADDFPARPPEGGLPPAAASSDLFRPRTPRRPSSPTPY